MNEENVDLDFEKQDTEFSALVEDIIVSKNIDLRVVAQATEFFLINSVLQLSIDKEEFLKRVSEAFDFYSKQ